MSEKEKEHEHEGVGEEAPPPYHDIVGWMTAHGLETEGVNLDEDGSARDEGLGTPVFSQTSPPLPLYQKEKPCINHCGTMVKSTFCFCCSKTGSYAKTSNQMVRSLAEQHHAQLMAQAPHFVWNIKCWHDEVRTREVYHSSHSDDGGGGGYYTTESYTVQVTTHTATKIVPLTGFFDTSPEKRLPPSPNLFTRVSYKNAYTWRTVEEQGIFQTAYNAWVGANTRDMYQSHASTYQVPGLKNFVMEVQEDQTIPCCFASTSWFWCTGCIGCGYCYRIGLKRISGKRDCHITKTIWMAQSERQHFQTQQFVQQQPQAFPLAQNGVPFGAQPSVQQLPYGVQPAVQQQPYGVQPAVQQQPYGVQPAVQQQPYGVQPSVQQQPQAFPASVVPLAFSHDSVGIPQATGGGGGAAEVAKLMQLRDQGALTEDEFTAAKRKALGI